MGLDAYAFAVKPEDAISDTEFLSEKYLDSFDYFRKHHSLNNFMIDLYYQKGGVNGVRDCYFSVRLTRDDLQKLKYAVLHNQLPEGYDLCSRRQNIVYDLKFIKEANRAIADGYEVYYSADW